MKKQYISTVVHNNYELDDELLSAASITGVNFEGIDHDIEVGGEAEGGTSSDSRRWSVWGDDESY